MSDEGKRMAPKQFSQVYVDRVLNPAFQNWKMHFGEASFRVHKAHLCMLDETHIITAEVASRIARGIAQLEGNFAPPERIPQGVEDLYFLFEKALGEIEDEEEAAWLHTARSRNDMDTTIFRLVLRERFLALIERLLGLLRALRVRCEAGENELMVLFTHGQPANPSTTAHYLSAFLMDLLEDAGYMLRALGDADRSTMGACAITGTGFPIDRARVSELLGFEGYIVNTYQAISTSHWLVPCALSLQNLMLDVGRFAADLLHKASSEVGLYRFPDELVQISSIMPQKRNPVILEHIRIQAEMVAGACENVANAFRNVPYQDVNEDADLIISKFLETIGESVSALDLLEEAATKMTADTKRAREICAQFGVTTTELADSLVRAYGIGFRMAHHMCSEFVTHGYDLGALRRAFFKQTGAELGMSDSEIEGLLSPETFVRVRATVGGPAPGGMREVYRAVERGLDDIEKALASRKAKWERAAIELEARFGALKNEKIT